MRDDNLNWCCQMLAALILGGFMYTSLGLSLGYYPNIIDHGGENYFLSMMPVFGSVSGLFWLWCLLVCVSNSKRKLIAFLFVTALLSTFGVLIAGFAGQDALFRDHYHNQCRQLGYDYRMQLGYHKSSGHGYLQTLHNNSMPKIRLIRTFSMDDDDGIDIQFYMDLSDQSLIDISKPIGVDVHMETTGRNTSIYGRYPSPSRRILIGNATFYKKKLGLIDLSLPNGAVMKLRTDHRWFTNPNKILNENGTEVARTLPKLFYSGKHIAICFSKNHFELGMTLGALTQNFQALGENCNIVWHYASVSTRRRSTTVIWETKGPCIGIRQSKPKQ